jgi:pimeloyl-ACP methyl ester carboxylesterase
MQRMADVMPNARFEVVKGRGHLVHLERPGPFNSLLQEFLKSLVVH